MRTDERDGAMSPLTCRRCGTTVQVRKSGPAQTSIQWLSAGRGACAELSDRSVAASCTALRDTIDEAVRSGALPVAEA